MDSARASVEDVLSSYEGLTGAHVSPLGAGLINETFLVEAGAQRWVLQRVSRIFPPEIHENIRVVTERLAARGLVTPRLLPTRDDRLYVELGPRGLWRLITFVDGVSFDVARGPAQARAAGALVGRFHAALDDLPHRFSGLRTGVHDTARHLARLREAVETCRAHRLWSEVAPLAEEVQTRAAALPALPALADRLCHGDLKFNNVLFAGADAGDADRAICLIDLDTVGPQPLAYELGDAWRSWCNRAGEDSPEAALDLNIFEASLVGYQQGLGRALASDEARALLLGVEWISLELAARFAADALFELYFGWNAHRFRGRGEHNLVRARGQLSLHRALVDARGLRSALLKLVESPPGA